MIFGHGGRDGQAGSAARVLRILRAFAEGSIVALGSVFAILAIGIPVALAARALHALGGWLGGGVFAHISRVAVPAAWGVGMTALVALVACSLMLFFSWRQRLRTSRKGTERAGVNAMTGVHGFSLWHSENPPDATVGVEHGLSAGGGETATPVEV